MTEKTISLLEKLSRIQCELRAPKNQYNKFGKFYYRNCEDILEAVKPLCNINKTTLIISDVAEIYDGWHYIKAVAELHDWESDKTIKCCAYAREGATKKGMDESQITGSTSSYARKYALNGLFNIDDTKDADTDEHKKQQDKPVDRELINQTKNEYVRLREELKKRKINCQDQAIIALLMKLGIEDQTLGDNVQHNINICNAYKELIRMYDNKHKGDTNG